MRARRIKLVVLAATVATVAGTALLLRQDDEPVGRLSRADMRAIRTAIVAQTAPLSVFTLRNLRAWPALIQMRRSVRITRVMEDNSSIGITKVHPDGTKERRTTYPSFIVYTVNGQPRVASVIKKDGLWQTDYSWRDDVRTLHNATFPSAAAPPRPALAE